MSFSCLVFPFGWLWEIEETQATKETQGTRGTQGTTPRTRSRGTHDPIGRIDAPRRPPGTVSAENRQTMCFAWGGQNLAVIRRCAVSRAFTCGASASCFASRPISALYFTLILPLPLVYQIPICRVKAGATADQGRRIRTTPPSPEKADPLAHASALPYAHRRGERM